MERALKERLVGAAVLMAAAVILIPEMLSGPRRSQVPQPAVTAEQSTDKAEANRKRYTIDMQRSEPPTEISPTPTVIEEPAPPPEEIVEVQPPVQATPEPAAVATAPANGELAAAPPPEPAPQPAPESKAAIAEPATPAPAAPAPATELPAAVRPAPAAAGARRWAVRLIAYPNREQAQRMAEDLREGDLAAFVLPVQTPKGTMYSVRIGPFEQRADAEAALRNNKVKGVMTSPEIVVQP